ncbi:MAG: polyprenyl synthetase family protein [Deltaproteobacteria bacterium]
MQVPPDVAEIVRRRIDERLTLSLDGAALQARERAREALPTIEQIRALTMRGGKRLRPLMVMSAVECIAPWESLGEATIDVGAAIELLQTYLLVHDDWIDGDSVRRGGPTVHVALTEAYGNAHLGASVAVLAGDMASSLAQDLIVHAPMPPERLRAVLAAYVVMQREVILGQVLDVLGSSALDAVHDLKTGSYTVRGPLALGHALAGGSPDAWQALEAFAGPVGIAFQLRDDLIGAFGDEQETGKSAASDLRAGKRTAPVSLAIERLDESGRRELEGVLGRDDDAAVERARALIDGSGARAAVEDRIAALRERALAALIGPSLRVEGARLLSNLAHDMTERRK